MLYIRYLILCSQRFYDWWSEDTETQGGKISIEYHTASESGLWVHLTQKLIAFIIILENFQILNKSEHLPKFPSLYFIKACFTVLQSGNVGVNEDWGSWSPEAGGVVARISLNRLH